MVAIIPYFYGKCKRKIKKSEEIKKKTCIFRGNLLIYLLLSLTMYFVWG